MYWHKFEHTPLLYNLCIFFLFLDRFVKLIIYIDLSKE
jgi:hypothetical protein